MAKLVLYCDQDIPENYKINRRLLELLNKPIPRLGYIPSGADPDGAFYGDRQTYYSALGIDLAVSLVLSDNFNPEKVAQLFACDGIHLSGGNTYHFLYWLRKRGLMQALIDFARRGGVLVGASAGAILMTPEISSSAFCADVPLPGEEMGDLSALGLVDFAFFPHTNNFPEHEAQMIEYSLTHDRPIYGCANGDGIVVDGDKVEFLGRAKKVEKGVLTVIGG
jgi:dipeptidase E